MSEKKTLYESPGEKGKRGAEQSLNGFMAYVRRQRAGSQDYGDKGMSEESIDFDISSLEEESD